MFKHLTRQQLYELAWDRPMTKLASEFGLSDVALHKICRKHRIPTPPAGYWAKKAHGKRVSTTPLPDPGDATLISIRESAASNEPPAIAEGRLSMLGVVSMEAPNPAANAIVERTLARLGKARKGADGLVRSEGRGLVRVAVRPESLERAGAILGRFVAAGEMAGLELISREAGASWRFDGETIDFELAEVADQVEHVATEKELAAVAKWKRERDEDYRRFGYLREWGEPRIPKWDQRYQGRLAIKLEELRIQSERSWWGQAIRRTFSDTRTRDVSRLIPNAIATVAAIAAGKKHNREMEARRRAAEHEAARLRAQADRRRLLDQKAGALLEEFAQENAKVEQLRAAISALHRSGGEGSRTSAFSRWAQQRLADLEARIAPESLERRLAEASLFEDEPPNN